MLKMTSAIMDEELGGAPFSIIRKTYTKSGGETVLLHSQRYETYGTVHPAKSEDLLLVPEEYRTTPILIFHSPILLTLGRPLDTLRFTAPDSLIFRNRSYIAISVSDWMPFGFCKVLAVEEKYASREEDE